MHVLFMLLRLLSGRRHGHYARHLAYRAIRHHTHTTHQGRSYHR